MRRASLFLALQLLLTGIASAWSPYSLKKCLSQLVFSTSPKIPQIVLDTRHPWFTANHARLSRYPNVAEALCSRNSSLWTSPPSPDQAPPADLFKYISIHSGGIEFDWCQEGEGWPNVRHRLRELVSCEAAMDGVRHLSVDLDVYGGPKLPPAGLPESFADALAQMGNLERLDWGMSHQATRDFERAFVEKGLVLPSVTYLQPSAGGDYMVSRCPNVEVLEAGSYFHHSSWNSDGDDRMHRSQLIKASTGLENLKEWRLFSRSWTSDMLEGILSATPNITTLHMDGYLQPSGRNPYMETRLIEYLRSGEFQPETIEEYLRILSLFPNLENLQLPASWDLDMGFDGGHWCGNAYDGPAGRAYGRQVAQEGAEATEFAANITMSALPGLKSLKFGSGSSANLTLNDHGQPDMTWPWTGRMEQYTYDVWPEIPDLWEDFWEE